MTSETEPTIQVDLTHLRMTIPELIEAAQQTADTALVKVLDEALNQQIEYIALQHNMSDDGRRRMLGDVIVAEGGRNNDRIERYERWTISQQPAQADEIVISAETDDTQDTTTDHINDDLEPESAGETWANSEDPEQPVDDNQETELPWFDDPNYNYVQTEQSTKAARFHRTKQVIGKSGQFISNKSTMYGHKVWQGLGYLGEKDAKLETKFTDGLAEYEKYRNRLQTDHDRLFRVIQTSYPLGLLSIAAWMTNEYYPKVPGEILDFAAKIKSAF